MNSNDKLSKIKEVLHFSYMTNINGKEISFSEIVDELTEYPPSYNDMRNDIIKIIKILLSD